MVKYLGSVNLYFSLILGNIWLLLSHIFSCATPFQDFIYVRLFKVVPQLTATFFFDFIVLSPFSISESIYCYILKYLLFSSAVSNLLLFPPSEFFISDIIFLIYRSLIWTFMSVFSMCLANMFSPSSAILNI